MIPGVPPKKRVVTDYDYACGYNGSYFKGSLGTAWVFKGTLKGANP
jgi:hypothetical protein